MLLKFCANFREWETWQNYPGNQLQVICSLGIEVLGLTPVFEQLALSIFRQEMKNSHAHIEVSLFHLILYFSSE